MSQIRMYMKGSGSREIHYLLYPHEMTSLSSLGGKHHREDGRKE